MELMPATWILEVVLAGQWRTEMAGAVRLRMVWGIVEDVEVREAVVD